MPKQQDPGIQFLLDEDKALERVQKILSNLEGHRPALHNDLWTIQLKGILGRLSYAPGESGGLATRTGNLRSSFREAKLVFEGDPKDLEYISITGTHLPYAVIQELGGRIEPKDAKVLAIPIGEALTEKGVHRYSSPGARISELKAEGDFGYIPIFDSPNIRAIVGKLDENDDLEPEYLFADYVDIEAQHYVANGLEDVREELFEEFAHAFDLILDEAPDTGGAA